MVACLSVIAGCLAIGLFTLTVPDHKAYHKAKVRYVGVRHGSKQPGARVNVELADGRAVFLTTRAYVPGLASGSEVCVQELENTWWRGGTYFTNALPSRCVGLAGG